MTSRNYPQDAAKAQVAAGYVHIGHFADEELAYRKARERGLLVWTVEPCFVCNDGVEDEREG